MKPRTRPAHRGAEHPQPCPPRSTVRWWLIALLTAIATWAMATPVTAAPTTYLYWTDYSNASQPSAATVGYIGRARIDGTAIEPNFVKPWSTNQFRGIAAYGPYLYVTTNRPIAESSFGEAAIARLKTDGTEFNDAYVVPDPGRDQPGLSDVAVGPHGIYWSAYWYDYGAPLGHATLSGGSINTDFADLNQYNGSNSYPALNSSTLFFTTRWFTEAGLQGSIAKVNPDGSGFVRDLIPDTPAGGLTATDQHVYFVNGAYGAAGKIGRAKTDGSDVTSALIPDAIPAGESGGNLVNDGTYLYWIHGSKIGRAKLDGTDVRLNFIETSRERPVSLAIGVADSSAPPPPPPLPPGPQPLPDPDPEPDPGQAPAPSPAPQEPTPAPAVPTSTIPHSPVEPKAAASVGPSRVRGGKTLVIRLKNVPSKAKLVVRWKPKRGKAIRRTVVVSKNRARVAAPKKKGRYRVTVTYRGRVLVKNKAVVVR